MRVKDAMTRSVESVRPDASLKEVAAIMVERGISGLPVVDEQGRVLGVVSESDFLLKERGEATRPRERRSRLYRHTAAALSAKVEARTAGDVMTSPAITIHPDSSLADATSEMVERGVNRMPVVQGDRLLGILTRADLVRAFARGDAEIAHEIRDVLRALAIPLDAVSVSVEGGEVWLAGELEARSMARAAAKEVRRIVGVLTVHSTLTWRAEKLELESHPEQPSPPPAKAEQAEDGPVLIHEP